MRFHHLFQPHPDLGRAATASRTSRGDGSFARRPSTTPRNWSAQLGESQRRLVSIADTGADGQIGLHPLGQLAVKQNVVPLELQIAKFGDAQPADANLFTISGFSVNGKQRALDRVKDFFAPAQFLNLSDDEKLTAPSFRAHGRRSQRRQTILSSLPRTTTTSLRMMRLSSKRSFSIKPTIPKANRQIHSRLIRRC